MGAADVSGIQVAYSHVQVVNPSFAWALTQTPLSIITETFAGRIKRNLTTAQPRAMNPCKSAPLHGVSGIALTT